MAAKVNNHEAAIILLKHGKEGGLVAARLSMGGGESERGNVWVGVNMSGGSENEENCG